jgi:hypothetical protein
MRNVMTKLGLFSTNFTLTGHGIPHNRARLAKEQSVYQLCGKIQSKIIIHPTQDLKQDCYGH